MTIEKQRNSAFWQRARSAFLNLTAGGDWVLSHSATTRRNLTWFWMDGMFASASDNIVVTYLVIYFLALGATQSQIGIMSSISSLGAALMLIPGAMLAERYGKRRNIVLSASGWNRLALLLLAMAPFIIHSPLIILVVIGLSITRDAAANLNFPAWIAMTGDFVPIEGRGRFFSSRNFIMGISGIIVTLLAGFLISSMKSPHGYQVSLVAACLLGGLSLFSFSHIVDRPKALPYQQTQQKLALGALLREITTHRDFLIFAITTAIWNFSLNIAGPFFTVFLVKNLHANANMVALTTIASSIAAILIQRRAGDLNDLWGARKLTMICGLLIPVVPLMWIFATAAWNVIVINLFSGVLWAGYNLGAFNYLLIVTPEKLRARYSAIYQIVVTVSLALGAALGSFIVANPNGFHAVFFWSAIGRWVSALLFVWLVRRSLTGKRSSETSN